MGGAAGCKILAGGINPHKNSKARPQQRKTGGKGCIIMAGKALHTKSIWKSNLLSDIRIAKQAGFGALEMAGTKVWD